jgi:hypothetical protein
MMRLFSKKSQEGYLLIDNRESPGITRDEAIRMHGAAIPIGKGIKLETSTYTCSKCQMVIVVNPNRVRERGYCRKCDHDVCDRCALELKLNHVCGVNSCWHIRQLTVA